MPVAKNFGGESFDRSPFLPRIYGQSCFAAGLLEEGRTIPAVLDGDLGKQQAATAMHADQQTVTSDFDGVASDGLWTRKNAQLDFEIGSFLSRNRIKARVLKRRRPGGFADGTVDGANRQNIADTPA